MRLTGKQVTEILTVIRPRKKDYATKAIELQGLAKKIAQGEPRLQEAREAVAEIVRKSNPALANSVKSGPAMTYSELARTGRNREKGRSFDEPTVRKIMGISVERGKSLNKKARALHALAKEVAETKKVQVKEVRRSVLGLIEKGTPGLARVFRKGPNRITTPATKNKAASLDKRNFGRPGKSHRRK